MESPSMVSDKLKKHIGHLVRREFRSLLRNILLGPFVIAARLAGLRSFRCLHLPHEVHVRREILETVANDFFNRSKSLVDHKLLETFLQLLDHLYAVKHYAGANLNS